MNVVDLGEAFPHELFHILDARFRKARTLQDVQCLQGFFQRSLAIHIPLPLGDASVFVFYAIVFQKGVHCAACDLLPIDDEAKCLACSSDRTAAALPPQNSLEPHRSPFQTPHVPPFRLPLWPAAPPTPPLEPLQSGGQVTTILLLKEETNLLPL